MARERTVRVGLGAVTPGEHKQVPSSEVVRVRALARAPQKDGGLTSVL